MKRTAIIINYCLWTSKPKHMVIGYRENIKYRADLESWVSDTNKNALAMLCGSRPNEMADRHLAQLLSDDCW